MSSNKEKNEKKGYFGGYSKEVMEHFMEPKNVGELDDPDGKGRVGNPQCGDILQIHINVEEKDGEEIISDIKFKTLGCAAALATSDMVAELAKGKTLDEAKKITRDDVADALGDLPKVKMHCSNLASDALEKAIENYRDKCKGEDDNDDKDNENEGKGGD